MRKSSPLCVRGSTVSSRTSKPCSSSRLLWGRDPQKTALSRFSLSVALRCRSGRRSDRVLADERFAALLEEAERAHWKDAAAAEAPIVLPPTAFLVANTEGYVATIASNTRHALDAGVPVALGTDGGPGGIATHLELEFLQAGGLTPVEVLTAATYGGAVALGREADLGSVAVGKLADITVCDLNLMEIDPADILDMNVEMTIVDGEIVFRRGA